MVWPPEINVKWIVFVFFIRNSSFFARGIECILLGWPETLRRLKSCVLSETNLNKSILFLDRRIFLRRLGLRSLGVEENTSATLIRLDFHKIQTRKRLN